MARALERYGRRRLWDLVGSKHPPVDRVASRVRDQGTDLERALVLLTYRHPHQPGPLHGMLIQAPVEALTEPKIDDRGVEPEGIRQELLREVYFNQEDLLWLLDALDPHADGVVG